MVSVRSPVTLTRPVQTEEDGSLIERAGENGWRLQLVSFLWGFATNREIGGNWWKKMETQQHVCKLTRMLQQR